MKLSRTLFLAFIISIAVQPAYAFNDDADVVRAASNINQAETSALASLTAEEIKTALTSWVAAMETGSSTAVLPLYVDSAILLPTLSSEILTTPEARKTYFDKLTAHKNLKIELQQAIARAYGDTAIASGLYTFSYTQSGKTVRIPARFSFVYKKGEDGRLLIIEHHSSKLPKQ
ncbi:MAG: DUF4440 domain-containing protein [Alphaproteobacteria bacterium]